MVYKFSLSLALLLLLASCGEDKAARPASPSTEDLDDTHEGEVAGDTPTSPPPTPEPSPVEELGCGPISFDTIPTEIGGELPAGYEPSGADWHERLGKLFLVSDGGIVSAMNKQGGEVENWNIPGDLEAMTIPSAQTDLVYLGVENPDGILEFNISTGTVTRTFDLTPWMTGPSNAGLEALTFVEDETHPEGGLFYAGHQGEGAVYVFEVPIQSSSSSTSVRFVQSFQPVPGRTDLADMDYDPVTQVIYAIYDGSNRLITMRPDGTILQDQPLPHNDQEGFSRNASCDLFIAQDTGKQVWYYEGQPSPVVIDEAAVRRLGHRIVQVQNNNGSFGWQRPLAEPLDLSQPGFQNVTGITALGLFDAMDLLQEPTWQETSDRVAAYLEGRLDLLLTNPADVSLNLSCPNWTFLANYLARNPNPNLQDKVVRGLHALLDARDATFGDNPSMRVDGLFNRIITGRATIPGIIPWDLALCVEGLEVMASLNDGFEQDYEKSLILLNQQILSSFFPSYDTDPLLSFADISLSMPIFVMKSSPYSDTYISTINQLKERLVSLIQPDGSVTNGSDNDGPQQASIYALLAFKILHDPFAQSTQDYLQAAIDENGIIADPDTQVETFEVEGEALRALSLQ